MFVGLDAAVAVVVAVAVADAVLSAAAEDCEEVSSCRATIMESNSGSHLGHGHAVTNVERHSRMTEYS